MFDSAVSFQLRQIDLNKRGYHPWLSRSVYVFFVSKYSSRRKYIAYLHHFGNKFYSLDFHATQSGPDRYRKTTSQFATGQVGANLIGILTSLIVVAPNAHVGLQCASMPYEKSDVETRRFTAYLSVLEAITGSDRKVLTDNIKSRIFVIPASSILTSQELTQRYEAFFERQDRS